MRAEGILFKVFEKKTKVGYMTYQIKLEDDDKYYGTFKVDPSEAPHNVSSGDFLRFDYSTNAGGWHNVEMDTLTVEAGVTQESTGASAPAKAAAAKVDGRQSSIMWQSARNAAIELAAVALDADVLDLGTKKDQNFAALQVWVNQQTSEYYDDAVASQTGNPFLEG